MSKTPYSNPPKNGYLCGVKLKGYLMGSIAAATYGLNPLFALPLYADGMDADSVLFFRYLLAVPAVGAMLLWRRRSFAVARRDVPMLALMALMMALSSLFLFESYNFMDASIASTLLFVYPLMVAVIMAVFFGERLTPLTVTCIAVALGGIFLLFKNPDGGTLSPVGTAIVMLSSLSYAAYMIGVNRPRLRAIPTLTLIFYVLAGGAMLFACKIIASPGATFTTPRHPAMWLCVAALALLPTVVSFVCTTVAVQTIGPTPTAILGALEPATAVMVGVLIFHEELSPRDWLGLALIIAAVSCVVAGGKITAPLVRFRKLFPSLRRKHN